MKKKKLRGTGKLRRQMGEDRWAEYQKKRKTLKVIKWRRRMKKRLIEYKGGQCEKCGYDKECSNAYEFHHKDPSLKDFSISKKGRTIAFNTLQKEIDKCCLLCSNCHREIHQIEYDKAFEQNIKQRKAEIEVLKTV